MSGEEVAAVMEVEFGRKGFNVHYHHSCDGCNASPIIGKRFKSTDTANFDLCSTCFEKYDGDELFAETLLARDSNNNDYVLKIKTSDGPEASQIRRINVADLWEDAELSYAKLIAVAAKFASYQDVDMSKARATYIDADGDKITISSNHEFMDSFRQSLKPTRKPFRITINFPTDKGVKSPPAPTVAAGKHPRRIIRIEKQIAKKSGELEALKVKAKLASARPTVACGGQKKCGWMDAQKFDSSFFIHARHTCDGCSKTPIIGARYRATHIPDFDLCSSCYDKYEGEKSDFKKEALECDRNMQKRWLKRHLSNSRMCEIFHASPPCEGNSNPGNKMEAEGQNPVESVIDVLKALSPAVAESLKEVKIHVSPTCEGLSKKVKSEEQASKAEECVASPACEGNSNPGNKTEAEGQNPVESAIDVLKALSPAVAESLKEVKIHVSPTCEGLSKKVKSEDQDLATEECLTPKTDTEEETNDVKPKSGSDDSKDDSFFSEADGNSIAEVIGKTLDVCVQAMEDVMIDNAVQKSSNDTAGAAAAVSSDAFSVASSIAAELMSANASLQFDANSKDNEDKVLKTEESSNGDDEWSVVTDENAVGETKQKDDVVKEEETDKSITSVEPISAVVLAKWDTELRQLHELGFLDDRINTNALEHLEASHLGCGSDEAVTVNAVVDHILKNID